MPLPPPLPPVQEEFAFDPDDKPKKKPVEDDDDEDERPRSKRRRDDDDEEDDDRPRKKRRRDDDDDDDDDDEDDDRPRSKRRRGDDDDDEDDEDERPRGKRRRAADDDDIRSRKKRRHYDDEGDDDEDDWHRNPKKKGNTAFGAAKTGVLLLNISFWLYMVSLGLIAFFIFLGWVGAFDRSSSSTTTTTVRRSGPPPRNFSQQDEFESSSNDTGELLVKLPGILGIGNWIVAGIGFGFCIAGPKRARGMAITAASLAGAHLVLAGISISNVGSMMGGSLGGGASAGSWILWATTLPILDTFLPLLIMGGGKIIGSDYIFMLLAAGCELARIIFAMLMVKALATSAKDYDSEEKAQLGMMGACIITGATVLLGLILALLAKAGAFGVGSGSANIMIGSILLVYLGFTGMTIMPILVTNNVRRSLARKARGK